MNEFCRKQNIKSKDSTEAELVALSDILIKVEVIQEFLYDVGELMREKMMDGKSVIYQDNTSIIYLVTKG